MTVIREPLDEMKLERASLDFAARLFASRPTIKTCASMEVDSSDSALRPYLWKFRCRREIERNVTIWMEKGVPSLEFGSWHTHADLWDAKDNSEALIDLFNAIMSDRFVLIFDVGGVYDGSVGVVDLREPDALVDELTGRPRRVEFEFVVGQEP